MQYMNKLEALLEIDDMYDEIYTSIIPWFFPIIKDSTIHTSISNLITLNAHLGFLKNALVDLYPTDNVVAMNIIFRSVIDYFLKTQYLFLKCVEQKNDDAAHEFMMNCDILDSRNERKALEFIKKNFIPSLLIDWSKDLPEITEHYSYKNIIKYIAEKTKVTEWQWLSFLVKLLLQYTTLSKFVHGGIGKYWYQDTELRQKEMLLLIEISMQVCIATFQDVVLLIYQADLESPILQKAYHQLGNLIAAISHPHPWQQNK